MALTFPDSIIPKKSAFPAFSDETVVWILFSFARRKFAAGWPFYLYLAVIYYCPASIFKANSRLLFPFFQWIYFDKKQSKCRTPLLVKR
jgi:hypothetical protein